MKVVKTSKCNNTTLISYSKKIHECQADRGRTVYTAQQVNAVQATLDNNVDPSMERIEEVEKSIGPTEKHMCSSMQRTNLTKKEKSNQANHI